MNCNTTQCYIPPSSSSFYKFKATFFYKKTEIRKSTNLWTKVI